MKIALIAGRNSIHTTRWANSLAGRGHCVHLISLRREGPYLSPQVKFHHLPFPAPLGYFLNVFPVRRLLKEIKPDLLHAHRAGGDGNLGRHCRYYPYILSVWGSDVYDLPLKSNIHRNIVISNLKAADKILSTSQVMAAQTKTLYSPANPIGVTPFGIDLEKFTALEKHHEKNVVTIGTVKTLAPKYGIDILIQAFAKIKKALLDIPQCPFTVKLLVVGGGPDRNKLLQLTKKLNIHNDVVFPGFVPHNEVPNYLNQLDIYVATSRNDSESFGVAVLEAAACCLPVVVSNVGGLKEVVRDNIMGFVVPSENVDATAKAILRLVTNVGLRQRMGKAGRVHVVESYSWEKSVDIMESIYKDIVLTENTIKHV